MEIQITKLDDFRIPDYPNCPVSVDRQPLSIINTSNFSPESRTETLTPALGITTILFNFHPNVLTAFLDLDAWFSMTWSLCISAPKTPSPSAPESESESTKLEIGRIANQITFGTLSADGEAWTTMLTFTIVLEGAQRGAWVPNTKESMLGERDVTTAEEIEALAKAWVHDALARKVWEAGKRASHAFSVEYAPMDVWGDGIPMSPHWLYEALDLSMCTTCAAKTAELQRCGKCGTGAYCCGECQRGDWAVHKQVCRMGLEDRGQALRVSEKGGLVGWDVERVFAVEGSGEKSGNPCLEEGVLKRARRVVDNDVEGSA